MSISSRKQAYYEGKSKYYTGVPCIRGHSGMRYTNTGACCGCISVYSQQKRSKSYQQKPKLHEVLVGLIDLRDVNALKAYVSALNFQRKVVDEL